MEMPEEFESPEDEARSANLGRSFLLPRTIARSIRVASRILPRIYFNGVARSRLRGFFTWPRRTTCSYQRRSSIELALTILSNIIIERSRACQISRDVESREAYHVRGIVRRLLARKEIEARINARYIHRTLVRKYLARGAD